MTGVPNLSGFALRDEQMAPETTDENIPGGEAGMRSSTQRNRDRIVWSASFRRTAYKTQVFPHDSPDHYRRRLTHSIEVSQLATSLTTILGLNSLAAEAIALGHDLGHTAFGHAGEDALDQKLTTVGLELLKGTGVLEAEEHRLEVCHTLGFGFTHYEQGVRVVEYLEQEYYSKGGELLRGLGLAEPTKDGILKHGRKDFPAWHAKAYDQIRRNQAFRRFGVSPTWLEGQAVAFADYLSYFVSDLEDAIRSKIIRFQDVEKYALIGEIKDWLQKDSGAASVPDFREDDEYRKFKRLIIKFIMLDTVKASRERLGSVEEPKRESEYAVRYSENLIRPSDGVCNGMDEVYLDVISEKIHKHHLVVAANFKARNIIAELFDVFNSQPMLIPLEFRKISPDAFKHLDACVTEGACGLTASDLKNLLTKHKGDVERAFIVRDYIAGMTDVFATKAHMRLTLSSESLF